MNIPMSKPGLSLEGKVAIVTGGGTGIGRSIGLEFAKTGADMDNLVKRTVDEFGVIDILVNNAAQHGSSPRALESDKGRWHEIVNTNLKSLYLCCQIEQISGGK